MLYCVKGAPVKHETGRIKWQAPECPSATSGIRLVAMVAVMAPHAKSSHPASHLRMDAPHKVANGLFNCYRCQHNSRIRIRCGREGHKPCTACTAGNWCGEGAA